MGTIGLKIKDRTYDRLKWLKTRFEFVHETTMSWDEFFERISKDVLLILAYDLKERSDGKVSAEDIFSILTGNKEKSGSNENEGEVSSMISGNASESGEETLTSLRKLKRFAVNREIYGTSEE